MRYRRQPLPAVLAHMGNKCLEAEDFCSSRQIKKIRRIFLQCRRSKGPDVSLMTKGLPDTFYASCVSRVGKYIAVAQSMRTELRTPLHPSNYSATKKLFSRLLLHLHNFLESYETMPLSEFGSDLRVRTDVGPPIHIAYPAVF